MVFSVGGYEVSLLELLGNALLCLNVKWRHFSLAYIVKIEVLFLLLLGGIYNEYVVGYGGSWLLLFLANHMSRFSSVVGLPVWHYYE